MYRMLFNKFQKRVRKVHSLKALWKYLNDIIFLILRKNKSMIQNANVV